MTEEGAEFKTSVQDGQSESHPFISNEHIEALPTDSEASLLAKEELKVLSTANQGLPHTSGIEKPDRPSSVKVLSKRYVGLLNSTIQELRPNHQLPIDGSKSTVPLQVGASLWTLEEQDIFFRVLPSCGPGGILRLSRAIQTKSESEVKVFMQLLQDGAAELRSIPKSDWADDGFVPAAFEISEECEAVLDLAANRVLRQESLHEVKAARKQYGDQWRIDEDLAGFYDGMDDASNSPIPSPDDAVDGTETNTAPDLAHSREDDADVLLKPTENTSGAESEDSEMDLQILPSHQLLQASSFIRLSNILFMNGPPQSDSNWMDMRVPDVDSSGPGIAHDTFEELYDLTVSITRRLVQTTLFQAMTRLRAVDRGRSWQPSLQVRRVDVKTACDILNMRSDWNSYWTKVARRCRVDVFSESKKYKDGRPGTKFGWKLTHAEVEAEMGFAPSSLDSHVEHEVSGDDYSSDDESVQSTATSSPRQSTIDEQSEIESEDAIDETGSDIDDTDVEMVDDQTDPIISTTQASAYEDYLEQVDRISSAVEEHRLWRDILGRQPPDSLTSPADLPLPRRIPSKEDSFRVSEGRVTGSMRREREAHPDSVSDEAFEEMSRRAIRNRKRRSSSLPILIKRARTVESENERHNTPESMSSGGSLI